MKDRTKATAIFSLTLAGANAAFAQQQAFKGTLTDSMCGASHTSEDNSRRMLTDVPKRQNEVRPRRRREGLYLGRP